MKKKLLTLMGIFTLALSVTVYAATVEDHACISTQCSQTGVFECLNQGVYTECTKCVSTAAKTLCVVACNLNCNRSATVTCGGKDVGTCYEVISPNQPRSYNCVLSYPEDEVCEYGGCSL